MKGEFKYNNKTFKWKFKIRRYTNSDWIGYILINYTRPWQIIGEFIEYNNNCDYKEGIEYYNNISHEEIEAIVKQEVIEHYEFNQKLKKFK